jgi:hypothetical protein
MFGASATVNWKSGLFELFGALSVTKFVLSATGKDCRLGSLSKADVCSGALRAKIANKHAINRAANGGIQ